MDSTDSPLEAVAGAVGPGAVEAFKLLSNETRMAILLALWEAFVRGHGYIEETVSQGPLRHRVSVPLENDELRLTLDEHVEVINVTR